MNYQGKLTNASGVALNGTYSIDFRIYDAATGRYYCDQVDSTCKVLPVCTQKNPTGFGYTNQPSGSDIYDDCHLSYTSCSNACTRTGEGEYCDGSGGCQTAVGYCSSGSCVSGSCSSTTYSCSGSCKSAETTYNCNGSGSCVESTSHTNCSSSERCNSSMGRCASDDCNGVWGEMVCVIRGIAIVLVIVPQDETV